MKVNLYLRAILFSVIALITFTTNAQFQWAGTMGGINTDKALSLCVDLHGNVFTTGYFEGTADFDPGSGTASMTSAGNKDIFITKFDSLGMFIWVKRIGGLTAEIGSTITSDSSGNIYLSGYFSGTVDFNPGIGIFSLISTGYDAYILKLDNNGNFLWVKQFKANPGSSSGLAIKLDNYKNIYLTGTFHGTVDFNTDLGVFNLYSSGLVDMFITKIDSNGNFCWAKGVGSTYKTYGNSLDVDSHGNVYTTGSFSGNTDFDPGTGVYQLSTTAGEETFISKLDSAGHFIWAKQFLSTSDNTGNSLCIDLLCNVLTTGRSFGVTDFDPGSGVFNLTSPGSYISKLDSSGNFVWVKLIPGEGLSITTDNMGNIYSTGHFECICDFDPGPGEFILESNALQYGAYLSKLNAAGTFVWAKPITGTQTGSTAFANCIKVDNHGNVYSCGEFEGLIDFDPGYAMHNLAAAGSSDAYVHKIKECVQGYYTMNAIACNFYVLNGFGYGLQGTYHQVLQSASGCDSILTLYLTLHTISNAISLTGNTLKAIDSGVNYQWINCPNNVIIPGATNQTFSPIINGNYAVIVSSSSCIDTSLCMPVTGIVNSLHDQSFQHSLQVTPNPGEGKFTIQSGEELKDVSIRVFDITGQLILDQQHLNGSSFQYDISNQSNGIYFIQLNEHGRHANFKWVKQ